MLQVNLPDATLLLVSQGCPFAMVSTAPIWSPLRKYTPAYPQKERERKETGRRERDIYIDPLRASQTPAFLSHGQGYIHYPSLIPDPAQPTFR